MVGVVVFTFSGDALSPVSSYQFVILEFYALGGHFPYVPFCFSSDGVVTNCLLARGCAGFCLQ